VGCRGCSATAVALGYRVALASHRTRLAITTGPRMALPEVSRESIFAAIQQFNERVVRESAWEKWTENKSQTYVIDVDGNIYPRKKIISPARGAPVSIFSGRKATNSVLRDLGFTVRRPREPTLSETLQLFWSATSWRARRLPLRVIRKFESSSIPLEDCWRQVPPFARISFFTSSLRTGRGTGPPSLVSTVCRKRISRLRVSSIRFY